MSQIFIQTRGKSIDYGFLIKSPSKSWWRDYSKLTAFEYPTLIIENLDGIPRIYLSAIPSKRKDPVQTSIRYTLVVEIEKDDHSLDDFILKLVSKWVNEVGETSTYKPTNSKIGNILDNYFLEEDVDRFLGLKHSENPNVEELNNKLENFKQEISNLPKPKISSFKDASSWGGIGNEKNRQDWIALVEKLLSNSNNVHGKALFLNTAEENDLQHILGYTTKKIICLINGHSQLQKFYLIEKGKNLISPNRKFLVAGSLGILSVFLITFSLISFSGNRLNESEVINFVRASCPQATTATKPALTSPNSENQTTNSKPTPNSQKLENQTTNSKPTPNSQKLENQTTNSKPTPNSQKLENQVRKEELATTEQLAHQLGVSENEILAEVKKCNKSFKQWSQKFGKGTWDFQIIDSQLKLKK